MWTEQAFIKANNPRPYNSFGVKLALSGDGNTLAVTAYLEDNAAQGVRAPEPQPFLIVDHFIRGASSAIRRRNRVRCISTRGVGRPGHSELT